MTEKKQRPAAKPERIIAAYEKWDGVNPSAEELAQKFGLSKAGFYGVLKRNGVELKRHRGEISQLDRIEQKLDTVLTLLDDGSDEEG